MVSTRSTPRNPTQLERGGRNPTQSDRGGRRGGGRGGGQVGTASRRGGLRRDNGSDSDDQSLDPDWTNSGLTLENYESQIDNWTEKQLREVLARRKNTSNRMSTEIQEALQFHKLHYTKIKLMLALVGNVTSQLVDSFQGEDRPRRRKSNWNCYVAFSQESADTPVPHKGSTLGWDERNGHLGEAWRALSPDEQSVFDAKIFRHFSKIPIPFDDDLDEDEEDENNQAADLLTPDQDALFRPLYERLVNHVKVKLVAEKFPQVNSNSKREKQVVKHVNRINLELFTIANSYNLTFYLLTSTQYAGSRSFCKELSNDPVWIHVAEDQWNAFSTFEAYSQGRAILSVVDEGPDKRKRKYRTLLGLS
ncbi:uncharacterized protein PGTG_14874 [Puccinia graminis f. sp. tritici CRL 75-36-700-3]|uniref:Uncharacterized protein n=1 Tax=Puccinia graminis f. sp. tritici (strain CRL 75-36-700-3 / race SCCL) TaxID=418459 RepID=E3KXU7_PUCGT|nr:uncharacterized protein PGTG_14874 [Puccinia graminis f. sp. tritici CRL 75-36-700-3]EFP89033.2 hypothetical protein PGTG_14874 [Puccinia graminis f. sp. tritici CRL 75-36-700-3]